MADTTKYIKLSNIIPEAFITVPGNDITITNETNDQISFFFNSKYIELEKKDDNITITNENEHIVCISVDPKNVKSINFTISNNGNILYKCSYTPIYIKNDYNFDTTNIINTDNSSFMLLRTNPLLSGNIKLVVDSNNNMYIDTFKVNNELSQKKYRKISVSAKSYYSNDIRNVFSGIDSDSLYGLPYMGDNINDFASGYDKQYIDTYNYGVKLNLDKLYSENFSMLAPLWINDKLPDFFVIFRIENPINNNSNSATDRFDYCIRNGKIIKTFDLRKNSELGNYLRNIQSEIKTYKTSAYITFENGQFNEWYGISIDKGIITKSTETTYDINKIPDSSQVILDNFITNGYKRNRMLNPYLINCEFMFDDVNQDMKMNQYIGLYISNNQYKKYETFENVNEYFSVNNINPDIFNNHIFNLTFDASISNNFHRIYKNTVDSSFKDVIVGNNILSAPVKKVENKNSQFITITINKPLQPGEHLRIINVNNTNVSDEANLIGRIYDVCGCRVPDSYTIDDYYNLENEEIINYTKLNSKEYIITHNNIFCGVPYDYDNEEDIIKMQIEQIVNSFNTMTDKTFYISNYDDRHISFVAYDAVNILYFERISSIVKNINGEFILNDDKDVVTYHNNFSIEPTILEISNGSNISNIDKLFMPLNYEIHNSRIGYIVDFTNTNYNATTSNMNIYTFHKSFYNNKMDKHVLYRRKDGKYNEINNFGNISYYKFDNNGKRIQYIYTTKPTNIIISPWDLDEYILCTNDEIEIFNNTLNLYSYAPTYLSVAGFMPIKDFNFTVLDKQNQINNKFLINTDTIYDKKYNDDDIITRRIINETIKIDSTQQYEVINGVCVDASKNQYKSKIPLGDYNLTANDAVIGIYRSFIPNSVNIDKIAYNIENINDYISNKIPLITPISCKWNLSGRDKLNNEIKVSKIGKLFNSNSLYLHSDAADNIFFGNSSFKFLNDNVNNPYIYNNLLDFVVTDNTIKTLRDHILSANGNIMNLLSNNNYTDNMFSRVYYNKNNNSLECIAHGQKVLLSANNNNINLELFNNYLILFVNSTVNSIYKPEIIIDETCKMILCINYLNSYNTTYSYRNRYLADNIYDSSGNNDSSNIIFARHQQCIDLKNIISNNTIPTKEEIKLANYDCSLFITANDDMKTAYYNTSYTYEIGLLADNRSKNITQYYIKIDDSTNINKTYTDVSINDNIYTYTYNIDNSTKIINETLNNINEYIIFDASYNGKYDNDIKTFNDYKNEMFNVIIKNNNINTINNGIILNFKEPTKYKNKFMYYYYCNPEFKNIFEFYNIDNELVNLEKTFISANTKIKHVNDIDQLWINKVYMNNSFYKKTNIGIDVLNNFNIFKTIYDDDYYRLYNFGNSETYKNKNGISGINNVKTFFGSIALNLYNKIKLDKWDKNDIYVYIDNKKMNNSVDNDYKKYNIRIDITSSLIKYFINNSTFISNFNNLVNTDDIINYVQNLIYDYFIINIKNNIEVYRLYNDNIDSNNKIIDYNEHCELIKNIDIDIINDSNTYYLVTELPIDSYQYAFIYTLNK